MVKHDQAHEALKLYRDRPTRQIGLPPTFVIRALSDLGEFDQFDLNIEGKLHEIFDTYGVNLKKTSSSSLSEIYWLTRYALLREKGKLSDTHITVLRNLSINAKGPALTQIPSLIAVAEAMSGFTIMDERMRRAALKSGNELRILLGANSDFLGKPQTFKLNQIAVVQDNWSEEILNSGLADKPLSIMVKKTQGRIKHLHGRALGTINQAIERLPGEVMIDGGGLDLDTQILLFRSFTHEFYKPLREAILRDFDSLNLLNSLFGSVVEAMTIIPKELEVKNLRHRLDRDTRSWVSGFIAFADQARLLPLIFEQLERHSINPKTWQVCDSFKAWDMALCKGRSSLWQPKNKRQELS